LSTAANSGKLHPNLGSHPANLGKGVRQEEIMKKSSSWTVDQIGDAHKQEVSKSVTTVLERETKLDPKAIEMMTQAVQSILLREVGSVVGEILDHIAEGATPLHMNTCTTHACTGNGVGTCSVEACGTLTCQGNSCGTLACGTKACGGHSCGTNTGVIDFFETPAWSAVLKDIELMTKHPELRQKISVSTRTTTRSQDRSGGSAGEGED
jgi:hypothetical protein